MKKPIFTEKSINNMLFVGSLVGYIISKETKPHDELTTLIRGYGADITYPASLYFMARNINPEFNPVKLGSALFFACTAAEFAQNLGWYPGTFDARDIAAYALGTATAAGLTNIARRYRREKQEVKGSE